MLSDKQAGLYCLLIKKASKEKLLTRGKMKLMVGVASLII